MNQNITDYLVDIFIPSFENKIRYIKEENAWYYCDLHGDQNNLNLLKMVAIESPKIIIDNIQIENSKLNDLSNMNILIKNFKITRYKSWLKLFFFQETRINQSTKFK